MSSFPATRSQFLYGKVAVRIDTNFAGDTHRLDGDLLGTHLGVFGHAARGSQCERSARSNGANAVVGLDNVSVTRDHESALRIGDDEKRLEVAQRAVLA